MRSCHRLALGYSRAEPSFHQYQVWRPSRCFSSALHQQPVGIPPTFLSLFACASMSCSLSVGFLRSNVGGRCNKTEIRQAGTCVIRKCHLLLALGEGRALCMTKFWREAASSLTDCRSLPLSPLPCGIPYSWSTWYHQLIHPLRDMLGLQEIQPHCTKLKQYRPLAVTFPHFAIEGCPSWLPPAIYEPLCISVL